MHTVESAAIVLEASKCRDQERKEGGQNREGGFSALYSGQTGGLTGARVTLQRGDFARTYTIVRKFSEQLLVKAINSWKSTACVSTPNIDLQTRMHTKFWYRGSRYAIGSVIPSNSLNSIPFVSGYVSRPRIGHVSFPFISNLFIFRIWFVNSFISTFKRLYQNFRSPTLLSFHHELVYFQRLAKSDSTFPLCFIAHWKDPPTDFQLSAIIYIEIRQTCLFKNYAVTKLPDRSVYARRGVGGRETMAGVGTWKGEREEWTWWEYTLTKMLII